MDFTIPDDLIPMREAALRAIQPLRPANESTRTDGQFLFSAGRTKAGQQLPPYHLVYFLLVDLLGFRDLGQWEKVAWSVPVDYKGKAFLIEHRKMGLGVFAHNPDDAEDDARQIVTLIQKGKPLSRFLSGSRIARSKDRNSTY